MSITIGAATFSRLTAQPYGYEETDTKSGQTARRWTVSGLMTPAEWLALVNVYDTWRNLKILEDPVTETGVVGATVALSGNGPGNQTWTNIPCWITSAPQGEQSGAYISGTCTFVHAAEYLAVLLKEQTATEEEDTLDLGTYTINGVVLKLLKPPDSYLFAPTIEQTAGGDHYITGPLTSTEIKDIEGDTTSAGWTSIRAWYSAIVQSAPATNSYFPIQPPTASASNKIVDGVKTVVYTVSVVLAKVK